MATSTSTARRPKRKTDPVNVDHAALDRLVAWTYEDVPYRFFEVKYLGNAVKDGCYWTVGWSVHVYSVRRKATEPIWFTSTSLGEAVNQAIEDYNKKKRR